MIKSDELGLLADDLNGPINLFVGAGFSVLANNASASPIPRGAELKELLIAEFGLEQYRSLELPALYAIIIADRRERLREFLTLSYRVVDFDPAYNHLHKLDIDVVYTTNIDDLCFHIFSPNLPGEVRPLHDNYVYGAPRHAAEVTQYIALHGCVRHEDVDFLFTSGQLSSAFASDRETWYVFQRELIARPTVFLGYSMNDAGVLQALHDSGGRSNHNKWILLRSDDAAAAALYKALGFHVIVGDTRDFLAYVEGLSRPAAATAPAAPRLPSSVPKTTEVAQRPVRHFFNGAEPEWSDAYSNQIIRRRANSAVKNSILSGRHAAIVGVPLSGKTTILKQVAADLSENNEVLYYDRITDNEAQAIVSSLQASDRHFVVCVDNLIDSRDSIDPIVRTGKALIVCAEQSLYFDSVSLKSMSGNLDVHSSSDVSSQDLQAIIDSIPVEVRRWNIAPLDKLEADAGERGLFESLRQHVWDEQLTNRFRAKLAEFENKDPAAFDVYLMACYVSFCRTILSYDMIFMFLDKKDKKYGDVYDLTARINGFLAEVNLPDDPHQDYFSVRSSALAKIVLKECSNRSFGRMFDRFHAGIPTRVIVDYPIFRRYAYDNEFARRAYPRIKDGLKFFNRLVSATDNAYDFQHGAIYLSKLKDFKQAFTWIDTALSKSRGRVFSIRNTHARILFEANIDVARGDPENITAVNGIVESMQVLKDCIERDQLRSYHLLRFSDQALQYAEVSVDDLSIEWLKYAREKLREIIGQATVSGSRESYNLKKYRNLFSEIGQALRQIS